MEKRGSSKGERGVLDALRLDCFDHFASLLSPMRVLSLFILFHLTYCFCLFVIAFGVSGLTNAADKGEEKNNSDYDDKVGENNDCDFHLSTPCCTT